MQLEQNTAELDYVLQNVSRVIGSLRYYADGTWKLDFISLSCERIYGYTLQELLADPKIWETQMFSADRDNLLAQIYKTIYRSGTATADYRFYHKDGRLRWISETFTSHYEPDLGCWKVFTVGLDITPLKRN